MGFLNYYKVLIVPWLYFVNTFIDAIRLYRYFSVDIQGAALDIVMVAIGDSFG